MDNTDPHAPAAEGRLAASLPASTASDTTSAATNAFSSNTLDIVLVSQPQSINIGRQAQRGVRKLREAKRVRTQTTNLPGYLCFSLSGEPVKAPQRSAFSAVRREEVNRIRKQGACLRCRLQKRPCSGENPCKRCLDAANAAAGSRALMWMDCIRLSFDSMNIFSHGMPLRHPARLKGIMEELGNESINLDFPLPFEMNIDESSTYLARWLTDQSTHSKISLIGLLSTSEFDNLISEAVGEPLGESLRLMVHLTTQVLVSRENSEYRGTSLGDIRMMRDHTGCQILSVLNERLKPQQLETSPNKLTNLKGLFLLVLGTALATRYVFTNTPANDIKDREKALLRLLCHYFVYIGNAISLLDRSCEPTDLLSKWVYEWNKPVVFGWQIFKDGPKQQWDEALSEPPPGFPTVCTEELGGTQASLDDSSIFETFTGLVACTNCGTLGPFLDINGRCGNCVPTFSMEDIDWAPFGPPNTIPTDPHNEAFEFLSSDFDSIMWPAWDQTFTTNDPPWSLDVSSAEKAQPVPESAVLTSEHSIWTVTQTERVPSANDPLLLEGTPCMSQPAFGVQEWQTRSPKRSRSSNEHSGRNNRRKRSPNFHRREPTFQKTERREDKDREQVTVDYPCPICSRRFCKYEERRQLERLRSERREGFCQFQRRSAGVRRG